MSHLSSCRPSLGPRRPISTLAPGEPSRALVDAALPSDELIQWLAIRLVGCRVPHDAAPLTPRPFVGFCRNHGAPNDRGERVFPNRHFQPPQVQSAASSITLPTVGMS